MATLGAIVDAVNPDWLQLHGKESVERVAELRRRFGKRVIKAVGIAGAADLDTARNYAAVADMLLLDAKPPKDATRPGGNANTFDWTILSGFRPAVPYLLSGGTEPGECRRSAAHHGCSGRRCFLRASRRRRASSLPI